MQTRNEKLWNWLVQNRHNFGLDLYCPYHTETEYFYDAVTWTRALRKPGGTGQGILHHVIMKKSKEGVIYPAPDLYEKVQEIMKRVFPRTWPKIMIDWFDPIGKEETETSC